jgi:hypothetical protein
LSPKRTALLIKGGRPRTRLPADLFSIMTDPQLALDGGFDRVRCHSRVGREGGRVRRGTEVEVIRADASWCPGGFMARRSRTRWLGDDNRDPQLRSPAMTHMCRMTGRRSRIGLPMLVSGRGRAVFGNSWRGLPMRVSG